MAERTYGLENQKVSINDRNIEMSVLRVLSILLSDKSVKEACKSQTLPAIEFAFGENKEDQVIHGLIEISILYRKIEHQFPDDIKEEARAKQKEKVVGKLIEKGKELELIMIEACNKIIHANSLNFDVSGGDSHEEQYLNPIIHIYGEKYGKEWKVELDVIKFCEYSMRFDEEVFDYGWKNVYS